MSRIGNLPINIPSGVEVLLNKIDNGVNVVVKGNLGRLDQNICEGVNVEIIDNKVTLKESDKNVDYNKSARHGLYRMLINNMIIGVSQGFTRTLELIGVGYKAAKLQENVLDLDLGFSHKVYFVLPDAVTAEVRNEKGKNIAISIKSCDKQLLGLVAARIRKLRKVEPYKGKGFRYSDEVVKLKAGKTATK